MLARTFPLNVDLAKQFAWLLRKDVRETYASPQDPGFDEWWLIKGRQEFPGWAHSGDPQALEALFAPNGSATLAGVNFEVPKIASLLAKHRPDALREFSRDGKVNNERFFAWVVVRGLAEHHLLDHVSQAFIAALDQPLPETKPKPSEIGSPPAATLLMYLIWLMLDKSTQEAKNIFTQDGRSAFFNLFFSMLNQLGISSLIAGRWRAWLLMFIEGAPNGPEIPRFSQIAWMTSAELRKKITLEHPNDLRKLIDWAEIAKQHQSPWAWIKHNLKSPKKDTEKENISNNLKPFGLNIYGFAYGELGIGEDLRMAVECCEEVGIPYQVINIDAGDTRQADMHLADKIKQSSHDRLPPYDTNLFCLPAFDTTSRVFMQKGIEVFEGYRNIGWWPWELEVFPENWAPYAFELVDEIWASSEFLFDMYQKATKKPIRLVPMAASVSRASKKTRKDFGLPENKYLYLFVFDFKSSIQRKNPFALIEAFKKTFSKTQDPVELILKVMNGNEKSAEWLEFLKHTQSDSRIRIIQQTLDRPEVLALIENCDAYVSLHRSEGFGRTLAEAMLFGKPVIATNYSGNVDFMSVDLSYNVNYKLKKLQIGDYQWAENAEAVWAEPDIEHAAIQLRSARSAGSSLNKDIKKYAQDIFSPKRVGQLMRQALSSK